MYEYTTGYYINNSCGANMTIYLDTNLTNAYNESLYSQSDLYSCSLSVKQNFIAIFEVANSSVTPSEDNLLA